ncbi:MAG: hypothetical protein LBC78_04125 [Oscillospiraceae bacterium]|jgi:hypothetical protein|nr:hypothetical protein [Oscillospiraceae bacterium]
MATTARAVFEITMALLDELSETTGLAERIENRDYLQRTLGVLTQVRGELYPYSDTLEDAGDGRRPTCPPILSLDDELGLDDFLCQSILPCALAARLVLDENPAVSSYYERKYQELLARRASGQARRFEPIEDLYGGARLEEDSEVTV